MLYTDQIISQTDIAEIIKNFICLYTDDYYYDVVEEKWNRGCYVYVANAITCDDHYTVYGSPSTASVELDEYLQDTVLTSHIGEYELIETAESIDLQVDYLRLLEEYVDEVGEITDFTAEALRNQLNSYLGSRIFQEGFNQFRDLFDTSINDSVKTLQTAVRTKLENKRRMIEQEQAKVVLQSRYPNGCTTQFEKLLCEYL